MLCDVEQRIGAFLSTAKMPLIVIVGPTASGKTRLSLDIAEKFICEIISADSRQLYRGMDIGTGKIDSHQMRGIPHHLLDVLDPWDPVSIAWYKNEAQTSIEAIRARGRVPILVGGSMLYVSAVIDGLRPLPSDPAVRARLTEEASSEEGRRAMHRLLQLIDPEAASRIPWQNGVYVARALEIAEITGTAPTLAKRRARQGDDLLIIGLRVSREELRERISGRVTAMLDAGWVDEVQSLLSSGVPADAPGMESMGYREIADALQSHGNEQARAEFRSAIEPAIAQRTMRYAKRQMTWWQKDERIHWIDMLRI